eukprot:TRINITY_DN5750_c0_g1_i1.p2 TRINITY_DN5750_c0_g1~~TRINITY_DN5750_c0_g1_i1.p2  ORF type:complete len:132 (+),score=0.33 TRINITY_DN5750_c0_g1_i1:327-722(+)
MLCYYATTLPEASDSTSPISILYALLSSILKNGQKTAALMNVEMICHTAPLHPLIKKPENTGGVVQGMFTPFVRGTRPMLITKQVRIAKITGVKMNGIIKIGFNTIGIPKINGSLMLNIPGPIANFPSVLN